MSLMKAPKIPDPIKYSTPVEIGDAEVTAARDAATQNARNRGYRGTVLTGFEGAGSPGAAYKTILGG